MAISTIQSPSGAYRPVQNDLYYIVSSTNVAQPNFSYIFDVHINGSGTRLTRHRIPPHVTNGYGIFNARKILESLVTYDIELTEGFNENANSFVQYEIRYGEEYGATPSITANVSNSGTRYAFNGGFDFHDALSYDQNDYLMTTSTTGSFLTNSPRNLNIEETEHAFLHFITSVGTDCSMMLVKTYDSSGVLNGDFEVTNNDTTDRFMRFGTGPVNLNLIPGGDITVNSGATPIIDSAVSSYTLQLANAAGTASSELFTYTITSPCTRYEKIRFQFKNRLGGFDAFTFYRRSDKRKATERSTFKRNPYQFSGTDYEYSKASRGEMEYFNRSKESYSVFSDWITEQQNEWLWELISSPEVFIEKDDELIAVRIQNTSHDFKKTVNEKLFNLKIEYTLSHHDYR